MRRTHIIYLEMSLMKKIKKINHKNNKIDKYKLKYKENNNKKNKKKNVTALYSDEIKSDIINIFNT